LCELCLSLQDPSRLAFGGGSFAGIAALMAAMDMPHVFGGVLVESPSLWTGEGRFLQVGGLSCSFTFACLRSVAWGISRGGVPQEQGLAVRLLALARWPLACLPLLKAPQYVAALRH
jgi:hypothetical protein